MQAPYPDMTLIELIWWTERVLYVIHKRRGAWLGWFTALYCDNTAFWVPDWLPKKYHRFVVVTIFWFLFLRTRLFLMIQIYMEDYAEISVEEWLLCSSEKRNKVLCIRGPHKHHSSPSAATTTLSSSTWTFWYITKATAATKGVIILHMQCGEFVVL